MYYQAYGVSNPYDLRCQGHVKWPEGGLWRSESTMGLTSPMTPRNDATTSLGSGPEKGRSDPENSMVIRMLG